MKRVNCLLRVSSRQQLRGDDIPVQCSNVDLPVYYELETHQW